VRVADVDGAEAAFAGTVTLVVPCVAPSGLDDCWGQRTVASRPRLHNGAAAQRGKLRGEAGDIVLRGLRNQKTLTLTLSQRERERLCGRDAHFSGKMARI